MFPPPSPSSPSIDLAALSGISGSISIACWVVVFSPQIIENFRRGSADGLSVVFIIVWLLGDVFNIIGAIAQRVLPTMVVLAVYYTLADVVLLGQVWGYRGFVWRDEDVRADELGKQGGVDGTHLSPATPLLDPPPQTSERIGTVQKTKPTSALQTVLLNAFALLLVCGAGVLGWWLTTRPMSHSHDHHIQESQPEPLEFDILGQVFGYLCAAFYLGSRIPQLLLNFRRKSTEGVSLLFFLFACVGNLTYDMSIFAYSPVCQSPRHCEPGEVGRLYGRYILINASWIVGSLGTLGLDLAIFVQFFMYRKADEEEEVDGDVEGNGVLGEEQEGHTEVR